MRVYGAEVMAEGQLWMQGGIKTERSEVLKHCMKNWHLDKTEKRIIF